MVYAHAIRYPARLHESNPLRQAGRGLALQAVLYLIGLSGTIVEA